MSVWMDQLEHKYLLPAVQWLPQASCFKTISLSHELASVCFKRHYSLFWEKNSSFKTAPSLDILSLYLPYSGYPGFNLIMLLFSLDSCASISACMFRFFSIYFFSNHEATHLQATKLRYKSKTGYFTGLINRFLLHCYSMTSPQRFNLLTSI